MVSIVIVSHSHRIAEGVAELAREMAGADVRIETAGGLAMPDHPLGTDAVVVQEAVERAWSDDGVLVLMDLGSAVLSAEMAVEFLPDDRRSRVLLCEAPLVEGAVAAAVTAKLGSSLAGVASEARAALAGKLALLGRPDEPGGHVADESVDPARERSIVLTVENEHGLHARPAARLVQTASAFRADVQVRNRTARRGPANARSINGVATLGVATGHAIEVSASGPDADEALQAIAALAARGFDEDHVAGTDRVNTASLVPGPPPGDRATLRGFAVSPGVVVGPARWIRSTEVAIPDRAPLTPQSEIVSLEAALDETRRDITEQRAVAARRVGEAAAAIFDAHLLFLDDEALVAPARSAIAGGGITAERAWNDAVERLTRAWAALDDEYLRARLTDVESVGRQVVAHLTGQPGAVRIDAPGVVMAADLSPADAAALDPGSVLGVATARGGPTSHAAVLARSLGIPAVAGIGQRLFEVREGVSVELDGERGVVALEPSAEAAERAAERERRRRAEMTAARAGAFEAAVTIDGTVVEVGANVGSSSDVAEALAWGADGVGLYRTEFLFLGHEVPPTEDEQVDAYAEAAAALGGRPLIVRTLDIGADKPLPFLARAPEANPFLGVRGIRMSLAQPEVLATQLRAVIRVSADYPLRVMFPMIATVAEVRAALAILTRARDDIVGPGRSPEHHDLQVGVMIEVPSAALTAATLAPLVDFFSIGTNDLSQYVLAADRGNEHVAALADPAHPAVLRLILMSCEAAMAAGTWVGVCGEVAGDALLTPLLLGLGVRELSMAPRSIPGVKRAVRSTDVNDARALADEALGRSDADAVRTLLEGRRHAD